MSQTSPDLTQRLLEEARRVGFDRAGIAPLRASGHEAFYRRWLDEGRHGDMAYLARPDAVYRRTHPEEAWPELRSALVVAHDYNPDDAGADGATRSPGVPGEATSGDPSTGVIARYARGRDYHKVVKQKLLELLRWLEGEVGHRLEVARAYVDTGPVLERELARRAGLGWFGRNTMMIHPRRGSYFFLGTLLLDLDLEASEAFEADHCGTCRACLDACPTGALLGRDESGAPVMDATRCISYLTIEQKGPIPEELRPLMGNRVYGCDICQEVCPWNSPKLVGITRERDYAPDWREAGDRPDVPDDPPGTEAPSLIELMGMTREEWDVWTRGSAIRRAGYGGFRRNVAVAIGNWLAAIDEAPENALAVIREPVEHDEPLVAEHAAWALERAG